MTKDSKGRPLSAIVGERLREFREAKGLRQADIAAAAAQGGLAWSRSSIAALEAGSRNLSIEELLVLPYVISSVGGWDEPLIPPKVRIAMNGGYVIQGEVIPRLAEALIHGVRSAPDSGAQQRAEIEELGRETRLIDHGLEDARMRARYCAIRIIFGRAYPQVNYDGIMKSRNFDGDLTSKITARLALNADHSVKFTLARFLPYALWGRPSHEERDRRTDARGEYESKRSLQAARGHATREMIAELNEEIGKRSSLIKSVLDQLEPIWNDEDALTEWLFENDPRNVWPGKIS
ncbi:helix-turn-helix domain-containing protein [Streptomyces ardesiacus]|uniref:Helix-turn-helix domain-containing protein n=1 Tax=Streptomyces ardesiacus TaxID=285564 RepID=A0ABW8H6Z0_9ACTN